MKIAITSENNEVFQHFGHTPGFAVFKTDENAVLIITHNTKILHSLKPDYVHILINGKIVKTGDYTLAKKIEEEGYEAYKEEEVK